MLPQLDQSKSRTIRLVNWETYNPPPSSFNSGQRKEQDVRALRWVRLQTDWHRDPDILDLPPAERSLWPAMLALAGQGKTHGVIAMNVRQLAREVDLRDAQVAHALAHLEARGRITCDVAPATAGSGE